MNSNKYQKYQIPPDFHLAQLHALSCRLYSNKSAQGQVQPFRKCGCCNQIIGTKTVSICQFVSSLRTIGQEVPLFFNFINLLILLCILIIFIKVGQMLFFCDSCKPVSYTQEDLWGFEFAFSLGYINGSNLLMMIQVIIYSLMLLVIKINLKMKKYKYRSFNFAIQKRSVQLINLPTNCSEKHINRLFQDYHIQSIQFTYKVRQYHECMIRIARLKKTLRFLHSRIMNEDDENIKKIEVKLEKSKKNLKQILSNLKKKKKRLSIAYVVFATPTQRNKALTYHKYGTIGKGLCKLFPCCSKNNIKGQHVTVESAPAPDDIRWENLENPYYRTKAIRISSLLICITMLVFGLVSEVIVFNTQKDVDQDSSIGQVFSSLVIFIINFLIINFLEFSTNKMQAHQSNTRIKLSLIRKITFFMFMNVSICPFLVVMQNRLINGTSSQNLFQTVTFTILIVSAGNLFKPLLTLVSISRFNKWLRRWKQKSKGSKSELNQLQANELFEPTQFPIQVYYSLIHASVMMSFFYLGCFQFLIGLELFSLILLYFISKWMLLKVCKQPRGLSLKLNNLAQSLMRLYVPLYWLGRNLTLVISQKPQELKWEQTLKKVFYQDGYQITSTAIIVFMLFCEGFVAYVAQKLVDKSKSQCSQYFEHKEHNRTYSEANLFFKIHEEGLTRQSIIIASNIKGKIEEESEEQIDYLTKQLM